jgi:hypothetical protein
MRHKSRAAVVPTKGPKKYWETKEFKKLNYECKMELYALGFDDIERSGDDGPLDDPQGWPNKAGTLLPLQSGASDFEMEAEGDESLESEQVQSSVDSINDVARDSLNDPETWKGLPAKAKRWWALQVLCGWSSKRAADHVGVKEKVMDDWDRVIRGRLCG